MISQVEYESALRARLAHLEGKLNIPSNRATAVSIIRDYNLEVAMTHNLFCPGCWFCGNGNEAQLGL